MSASIVKRGEGRWVVVVEDGKQPARRCTTCPPTRGRPRTRTSEDAPKAGRRFWLEELDGDACPGCSGPLGGVVRERRQRTHGPYPRLRGRGGAEEARSRLDVARKDGTYTPPSDVTVADVAERFIGALELMGRRPSTIESYRGNLANHLLPTLGHVNVQALTSSHLDDCYRQLLKAGNRRGAGRGGPLSARTVAYCHKIVHGVLKLAVEQRLVPRNVGADAHPPTPARTEMRVWTVEETRRFLALVEGDRLEALWTLLLTAGLRRGEALGLRWGDLDPDNGRLAIRRALVTVGYRIEWSEPKTDAGRRVIGLDPMTLDALRAHRRRQHAERLAAEPGAYHDDGLVFCDPTGGSLHPDAVTQRFDRLVARAGVPRLRLHDLRHTSATIARKNGVSLETLAKRLGHSSPRVTMEVYSHVDEGMDDDAAARLGAAFLGGQ
jgi:integrase